MLAIVTRVADQVQQAQRVKPQGNGPAARKTFTSVTAHGLSRRWMEAKGQSEGSGQIDVEDVKVWHGKCKPGGPRG